MSSLTYTLRIDSINGNTSAAENIIGIKSNVHKSTWGYTIEAQNGDNYSKIEYLLKLIEGKNSLLEKADILIDEISLWVLYQYDNECNLEFSVTDMELLSNNKIPLCISCWK